ncbi:hypothetical protein PITCH_A720018 [uncultured Desulfobacterium sp.]|uniref:Uncharacterized protein n=1 Tax=uncultured Desulfobacterium sp. TaxID=201089 RepID=A0A445N1V3_9BACT|nr:hypothetical protein PITCH_A720018 [uncultured Desulfobacterium sp.]
MALHGPIINAPSARGYIVYDEKLNPKI